MNPLFDRRTALTSLACVLLPRRLFAQQPSGVPRPPIATVALAPLGVFPASFLAEIDVGLRAELGVGIARNPEVALPRSAWYAPRRRYRAERLLDALRPQMVAPATRILGVTEVDISTTAHGVYD